MALSGGYPIEIFGSAEVDEKFICIYCEKILREPFQSYCGERFCKSCIENKFIEANSNVIERILEDGEHFEIKQSEIFPDNAVKRELNKKQVVCSHAGCDWSGTFKLYELHVPECRWTPTLCEHCGQMVTEEGKERHLQMNCHIVCPNACGAMISPLSVQSHIENECQKTQITCPQCKRNDIPRENLQNHIDRDCVGNGDKVRCLPCKEQGYTTLVDKKEFDQHFTQNHSLWVAENVAELGARSKQFSNDLESVKSQASSALEVLHQKHQELGSFTTEMGDSLKLEIRQTIEMQMNMLNDRVDTKTGTFEGIANTLHQEMDKVIDAITKLDVLRREHLEKITTLERTIAVKDAKIDELETKIQDVELTSNDGVFLWKISEFTKKHHEAITGRSYSIYSTPFTTSRRGYKMCARLYANGDGMGKGSHLSLFFVIMRGDYDALLPWPFKQRVTFTLINQNGGEHVTDSFRPDPTSSSFRRPTSNMNIASGCPLFLRLDILQNPTSGFLKDDTMFLKITVDLADYHDPMSVADERVKVA